MAVTVTVHRPELTPRERESQMAKIRQAVARVARAVERQRQEGNT